jgi:hypothetical protein
VPQVTLGLGPVPDVVASALTDATGGLVHVRHARCVTGSGARVPILLAAAGDRLRRLVLTGNSVTDAVVRGLPPRLRHLQLGVLSGALTTVDLSHLTQLRSIPQLRRRGLTVTGSASALQRSRRSPAPRFRRRQARPWPFVRCFVTERLLRAPLASYCVQAAVCWCCVSCVPSRGASALLCGRSPTLAPDITSISNPQHNAASRCRPVGT